MLSKEQIAQWRKYGNGPLQLALDEIEQLEASNVRLRRMIYLWETQSGSYPVGCNGCGCGKCPACEYRSLLKEMEGAK